MKVIFIEDVPDVALAGETKVVADGYGRNYLLPKKLAVLANSAASNVVEVQLKRVAVKRAQAATEMGELAKKLEGTEINLKARAGEKDRLYGSITAADIAQALSQSAGQEISFSKTFATSHSSVSPKLKTASDLSLYAPSSVFSMTPRPKRNERYFSTHSMVEYFRRSSARKDLRLFMTSLANILKEYFRSIR